MLEPTDVSHVMYYFIAVRVVTLNVLSAVMSLVCEGVCFEGLSTV